MKTIDLRPAQILFAEKGKLSTLMIYRIATKFQSQSLSPVPDFRCSMLTQSYLADQPSANVQSSGASNDQIHCAMHERP